MFFEVKKSSSSSRFFSQIAPLSSLEEAVEPEVFHSQPGARTECNRTCSDCRGEQQGKSLLLTFKQTIGGHDFHGVRRRAVDDIMRKREHWKNIMRIIHGLMLSLLVLTFTACQKNEVSTDKSEEENNYYQEINDIMSWTRMRRSSSTRR